MSFKKKLKKINRGLVLGGILIISLIVYIVVDTISFNKEKAVIRDIVKEYINTMCDASITDNPKVDEKGNLTLEMREEKKKKIESVVDAYWTDDTSGREEYSNTKYNIKEWINNNYNKDNGSSCIIDNMAANIKEMKVSKRGASGAKVALDMKITTSMKGLTDVLYPVGYVDRHNIAVDLPLESDDELGNNITVEKYDEIFRGKNIKKEDEFFELTIVLIKDKGEWKISSTVDYGCGGMSYLIDEEA